MATSTIAKADVKIKYIQYTAPAGVNHVSINANNNLDAGYKFLTWVGCTTQGYVGIWCIEFLDLAQTNAWSYDGASTASRSLVAYYLEKRI